MRTSLSALTVSTPTKLIVFSLSLDERHIRSHCISFNDVLGSDVSRPLESCDADASVEDYSWITSGLPHDYSEFILEEIRDVEGHSKDGGFRTRSIPVTQCCAQLFKELCVKHPWGIVLTLTAVPKERWFTPREV